MDSLAGLKPDGRQTLVVDQAEEAVTVCTDLGERERFFATLADHVGAGGGLVLSLRADHLGDLAPYPDIARVLEEGLYLLGPMSEPDLRSAIEGPARHSGLRLEPGLVDLLVREVEGEPAALPLLSHVLRETWEHREGPTLTVAGYRATGGIRSAVSRSAERLYDAMDDAQRGRLRTLLLRLVMPTEDGDPVRARVPRSKVAADDEHQLLVEQLVNARLVSIDGDTVQIAHEALVGSWPRLRGWLDDDVDGQRLFRHLAGAADAWEVMGRPDSELYRGARLARTDEWRVRADPDLNDVETAFLDASSALAASEVRTAAMQVAQQKATNRRLRGALTGVGVLLVLSVVAGVLALRSADRASQERDLAASERNRAAQAADLAEARRVSAQGALHEDLATALLLTVQSVRRDDSAEAWENLGAVLTRAGGLSGRRDIAATDARPGTAWMSSFTASTDGSLVAGCVLSGGVRLLDATGLDVMPFEDQVPGCTSLALSPDGARLAVALGSADDQPIRLYDLPGGTLSRRQPGGLPPMSAVPYTERNHVDVTFSHDGSRMVAQVQRFQPETEWLAQGPVLVWDSADPSQPVFARRLPRFAHAVLSPDGNRLYVAVRGDAPLRVYDVGSGRLLASARDPIIAAAGATAIDISPDGTSLAVATRDRVLRFDTTTLRPQGAALTGHTAPVTDVAFSHDGRLVAASSEADRTTIVWDGPTGDLLHRYIAGGPTGLAFSANDRTLLTVGADGLLLAWDLAGANRQLVLGEDSAADEKEYASSLLAPDGRTVARLRAGRLSITDTRTGQSTSDPVATRDQTFVWSPDSRWLISADAYGASAGEDRYVTLWDASTGTIAARSAPFAWDTAELKISFSPDAKQAFVSDLHSLHTLARESMRPVYPPVPLRSRPGALLSHPVDGSVFVLDHADGSYVRVDPRTGDVLDSAPAGFLASGDVGGVVSPDGTRMVVTGPDGRVRLLDVDQQTYIDPDSKWSWGMPAFAHDGSQYAVVQAERIRLWDGQTGEYQASLPLPTRAGTFSISYRPDGTGLVIASTDGRTWTADTRIERWVDRACAIAGRNLSHEEWDQFFPDRAYERTCQQWPDG
jgi:WD40 repeat protein